MGLIFTLCPNGARVLAILIVFLDTLRTCFGIPSFINESNEFMAFRLLDFIIYPIPLYLKIGRTLKKNMSGFYQIWLMLVNSYPLIFILSQVYHSTHSKSADTLVSQSSEISCFRWVSPTLHTRVYER